jgi:hypothetical protein
MSQVVKGDFTANKDSGNGNDTVQITVPQNDTAQRKTGTFVIKNSDGTKQITLVCTQLKNGEQMINYIAIACERILQSQNIKITLSPSLTLRANKIPRIIVNKKLINYDWENAGTIDITNDIQPGSSQDFIIQDFLSQQMIDDGWDWDCIFEDTAIHRSADTYGIELALMDSSGNYPAA